MNIHILRANGAEEKIVAPWHDIRRLIGAETLDTVNLRDGRVMMVDDDGYGAMKPVNIAATALYHGVCYPGTTHQILGDVAIVVDAEVDE